MELEVLKKSWDSLDKRMQQATTFNERLVESIISSRVMTTVDKIKRLYNSFYVVLTIEIVLLIGIILGNPFDFKYKLQYLPYGLLLIGVIIAFLNLLHLTRSIRNLSPGLRIDHYLKGIVSIYDRNKRFEKWFGVILLSIGLLVPFSFLPKKLERMGLSGALIDTAIMISISLIIYIIAFKLGAFKNRYKEKLQKDLDEWKELKALAGGMAE
jgi:hypothetical protein